MKSAQIEHVCRIVTVFRKIHEEVLSLMLNHKEENPGYSKENPCSNE